MGISNKGQILFLLGISMTVRQDLNPDNKVHGTNMGPTWVLSAPDGPHVGPINLAIREFSRHQCYTYRGPNPCILVAADIQTNTLLTAEIKHHIDGLVQGIRNSSALAMELRLSCTDASICQRFYGCWWFFLIMLCWSNNIIQNDCVI